ncbi:Asp-tRNA(Asn)/Glu-tRNA(Gln) amidotransferase subunit GatC [Candidatus Dojkabacteria bacterium]|nr:Asp-tRNA(Asn)/Glu-tRNA(Gln) amidotransferase subunit GatC [Candidatus Dojkabacteria bacterium]
MITNNRQPIINMTNEQVKHIAKLAKIKLTDAEVEKYVKQLSSILEYVNLLSEVEGEAEGKLSENTLKLLDLREDKVEKSLLPKDVLKNRKGRNNYFVIKNG